MTFKIRDYKESDWKQFMTLEFETMKTVGAQHYQKLIKENPGKTEDELIELYGQATKEDFDFGSPDCKIFVGEDAEGTYAGHVWLAERNSEDSWDIERPIWIYDITIHSDFRRQGLGKILMKKAEDWTKEQNRNLGLFVHHKNEAAIALYKNTGYQIKAVPMSKSVSEKVSIPECSLTFREMTEADRPWIENMGMEQFRRKVKFSKETDDEIIKEKYRKYIHERNEQIRYVGVNDEDEPVAAVWISDAKFSDQFALIIEAILDPGYRDAEIQKALIAQVEMGAAHLKKEKIYTLVHVEDSLGWQMFAECGYKIPGFFMEKRLK